MKQKNKTFKLKSEFHDIVEVAAIETGDIIIHFLINFKSQVDEVRFGKAAKLALYAEPILSCNFKEGLFRACWQYSDPFQMDHDQIFTVIKTNNIDNEIKKIAVKEKEHFQAPQVNLYLLRTQKKDTLLLKINHMVTDAAGIMDYINILSKIYKELKNNPDYLPEQNINGDRSVKQVLKQFSLLQRLKIFNIGLNNKKNWIYPKKYWNFPKFEGKIKSILYHTIDTSQFKKIKNYSKKLNVSINDVILAVVYRAYYETIKPPSDYPLRLLTTANVRRYLPEGKAGALCNLAAFTYLNIGTELGDSLEDTIKKIRSKMEDLKDKYIGLDDFIFIPALLKKFPYPLQKKIIKSMFKIDDKDKSKQNPLIPLGISNVGKINLDGFQDLEIENAHFLVPISYPPFFSLSVDSFGEKITFSTAFCKKDNRDKTIENFFNLILSTLPG